jgi:hypothetical protein
MNPLGASVGSWMMIPSVLSIKAGAHEAYAGYAPVAFLESSHNQNRR